MRSFSILLFLLSFLSFGQEVKLGMPVGHEIDLFDLSADGRLIITCGDDKNVRVWSLEDGKLIYSFDGFDTELKQLKVVNDSLLLCRDFSNVMIVNYQTGKIHKRFDMVDVANEGIFSATISHNEKYIAIGCDYRLYIFDLESSKGKKNRPRIINIPMVTGIDWSADDKTILCANWKGETKQINVKNGKSKLILQQKGGHYANADWYGIDESHILITRSDGSLSVASKDGADLFQFSNGWSSSIVHSIAKYLPMCAVAYSSDSILLYRNDFGRPELLNFDPELEYRTLSVSPNGKYAAGLQVPYDGTGLLLVIVDIDANKIIKVVGFDIEELMDNVGRFKLMFSDDESTLVGTCLDQFFVLRIDDNGEPNVLKPYNRKVSSYSLASNEDEIYITLTDFQHGPSYNGGKTITRINLRDGSKSDKEYPYEIDQLAVSKNGEFLALKSLLDTIRIFNTSSGHELHKFEMAPNVNWEGNFKLFEFSDNNKFLLIGDYERVQQYSLQTKEFRTTPRRYEENGYMSPLDNAIVASNGNLVVYNYSSTLEIGAEDNPNLDYRSMDELIVFDFDKDSVVLNELIGLSWNAFISNIEILDQDKLLLEFNRDSLVLFDFGTNERKTLLSFNMVDGEYQPSLNYYQTDIKIETRLLLDNKELVMFLSNGKILKLDVMNNTILDEYLNEDKDISSIELIGYFDHAIVGLNSERELIVFDKDSMLIELAMSFFYSEEKESWVQYNPSGFFDASPEAMELMYWTKGLEVIEFEQLKDRYWVPGLWSKVMKDEALPNYQGINELKLQPKVNLAGDNEALKITLEKRDGGYGKVAIFINGKEVISDARGNDLDTSQIVQTINYSIKNHPYLKEGENEIVVKASSADGFVQGKGDLFKVVQEEKNQEKPNFYGIVIGVDTYTNDAINLKYPSKDAVSISKAFQLGASNLFGTEKSFVYTITSRGDRRPNKENIRSVFAEVASKAKSQDVVLVYLSGHGITWGGEAADFYFLTADAIAANKEAYNDAVIRTNSTIATNEFVEWIKEIPALKQLMIIDACGSGKAVDNLVAERDVETSQIKAIDRMKDRTGMFVISGCAADAVSYEASQYGQGLLTYSILQAMKGAALKEDKFVDVLTMLEHSREAVPQLAAGLGGIQEPQLLAPKGGSFDIGLIEEEDRAEIPLMEPKRIFVRSIVINVEEGEDNLKLGTAINQKLIDEQETNVSYVFFDAPSYPNACKISGTYEEVNGFIQFSMKLRCGEDKNSFELKAKDVASLLEKVMLIVNQ